MKDKMASTLSWIFTIYTAISCAIYAYGISNALNSMKDLFAGLGSEIPWITRLVIHMADGPLYVAAALLIIFLCCKEFVVKSRAYRVVATVVVFIALDLFKLFVAWAIYQPLFKQISQIE